MTLETKPQNRFNWMVRLDNVPERKLFTRLHLDPRAKPYWTNSDYCDMIGQLKFVVEANGVS